MRPRSHSLLLGVAAILAAAAVQAAPITWSPAANTGGKADLIEGNVILAIDGGNGATITGGAAGGTSTYLFTGGNYEDLTFAPVPGSGIFGDASAGAPSTGDANFDAILKYFAFTTTGITSGIQTISGLTSGTEYRIQVFYNDQRNGLSTRVMTYGDGEASPHNVNIGAGGSGWGQHAVGTFTASGTTQSLTHATNGFANVHFNAILVVEPGPPPAPDVPTNLVATAGDTEVVLDWDDNTQPGFLEFRIWRATTPGGPYTQVGATANSIFADTTAVNGTPYYYVVTAVNIDGAESAPSAEVEGEPSPSATPPNFLFIMTDDQDTYSVGAYRRSEPVESGPGGNPYVIDTPNIDRLAAEGMLFHQARIMGSWTGAVCTASRTCIMTGRNTWDAQRDYNGAGLAANTFPGIFNRGVRAGFAAVPYATYRTCKTGNSYARANGEFNVVHDATKRGNTDGSGSEWHGDRGVDYIADWQANHRPAGKPFFIYLGFSHPHDRRQGRTTPDLVGRYGCYNTTNPAGIALNPAAPLLPVNHLPVNQADGIPANFPFHPFDNGHLNVRDEVSVSGIGKYRTEAVLRNEIGREYACVDWIDRQIGRVRARLEDPDGDGDTSDSVIDNTYIVFTSDHGMSIGRHGLQGKQNLYEHTWRVPYIVRGPGIAPGSETDALIYLHDTFPTFCDLAGLDLPPTIDGNDGRSFRSVLGDAAAPSRDHLYGLYSGGSKPGMRAITDGRFKIIKYDVGSNATQVTQMFDILENPFELLPEHGVANIATLPAYARVRARLEERMMIERRDSGDPYQFLGDRTLLRFEEGPAGTLATILQDRFPWDNDGTNSGGVYAADVPYAVDRVNGESNTLSLGLDAGDSISIPDDRALDMGAEPFTLEAYVKLGTLPTAGNSIPVISKGGDYLFYAGAGSLGNPVNGLSLRLGSAIIHSTLAITDSNWHYLGAALDPVANRVRFVLDEQVQTVSTTANGTVNNNPVILGGGSFDGLLDEVGITVGFLAEAELQPVDPTPPAPFRINGLSPDPGNPSVIGLTFESEDSRLYSVQESPDLLPDSWTDLRTFIPGAAGLDETSVPDLPRDPNAPTGFLRVYVVE